MSSESAITPGTDLVRGSRMIPEPNTVDILIYYSTPARAENYKTYTASYKQDTGVQQYLDYYTQGFQHDYPEAVSMNILLIEIYHNDSPERRRPIYELNKTS